MTDKDYTHICLVVDRSGSMHPIASDMDGGIKTLLADQAKQPGFCIVDVVTFDTEVEYPFTDVRPDDVKGQLIVPRGSTALNDAIGKTIVKLGEKFAAMEEPERPEHVIIVVVTDGMENASREYSALRVKEMVTEQTEKWNWTFMYLAANVDAFATGSVLGFSAGQTMNYDPSTAGVGNSYIAASANATRARRGDTTGFTDDERTAAEQS